MRNSLRVALLSLGLWPGLAFAGDNPKTPDAQTALCLELASTTSEKLSLSSLLQESETLLSAENEAEVFIAKTKGAKTRLCYGPLPNTADAALKGVVWQKEQPLFTAKARVEGFRLFPFPKISPKKGESKLGDPIPFDLTEAAFVSALRQKLGSTVRVGVVGTNKAYAFPKADAWLPSKKEALSEITEGARLLTLGQERFCEESAGCLFWEKTLLGDQNRPAYLPAGQMVYPEEGILSPDTSWKLFLRPRAALPYTPGHFRQASSEPGSASPCVSVAVWAKSSKKDALDFLGTVEIPGSSTEGLLISFTDQGVLVQDGQGKFTPEVLPVDIKKYSVLSLAEAEKAKKAAAEKEEKEKQKKRSRYRVHRVRSGDTLWDLANKYRTTVTAIRRANRLSKRAVLQLGQRLLIPRR